MADPSVKEGSLVHDISSGKSSVRLHHAPGGSSSFNIFGDEPSNAIPSTYKQGKQHQQQSHPVSKPNASLPPTTQKQQSQQQKQPSQQQPQQTKRNANTHNKPTSDFLSWD